MLKRFYAKKDEVPEALSAFYVEQDGGYVLQAEGHVDRSKVDEMRTENISLRKKVEELTAKFNGVDPEEFRRLAEEKRQLEESAQMKAGQFEKVLTTRLSAVKADFDKQIAAVTGERDAAQKQLVTIQIDRGVLEAATKRGLRPTAVPDITARARGSLHLVDGTPLVFEADGQTVRRGSDGVAPMTLDEWVAQQAAEAPHLFDGNAGGGAAGNGSGGAGGTLKNPFRKETWNLTEQMRLTKQDPVLAARLKAAV